MSTSFFGDFGKKLKELVEEKFTLGHNMTIRTSVQHGNMDHTVDAGADNFTSANTSLWLKHKANNIEFGQVQAEVSTCGKLEVEARSSKLVDNLEAIVKVNQKPKASTELKYKHGNMIAGTLKVESGLVPKDTLAVTSTLAVGSDGISVGGQVTVDSAFKVTDWNGGFAYLAKPNGGMFDFYFKTAKKGEEVDVGFRHNTDAERGWGARFIYDMGDKDRVSSSCADIAVTGRIDDKTRYKSSVSHKGVLRNLVQHDFSQRTRFRVATETNLSAFNDTKVGVTLCLGDKDDSRVW